MVLGHPSRSILSTPLITSSRISAQPTTRYSLWGELTGEARQRVRLRRGRLTKGARQSLRVLVIQSSAPDRGQHLTVPISTNDLHC